MKNLTSPQLGFSLLEVIVAMGLFSLVLLMIISIFSRFVFVERRELGEGAVQEDLRFAIELLNREARTGFGSTYETDGTAVYFRNQNGDCVTYQWVAARHALRRAQRAVAGNGSCTLPYAESSYRTLTGEDTLISHLIFYVQPAGVAGDRLTNQGIIILSLRSQARSKSNKEVALQSTVASRQLLPYHLVTP